MNRGSLLRGRGTTVDGGVPRSTPYGVYIIQLIRFARASCHVSDFNTCNKLLTQKLLKQGYRYHNIHKNISKFYRRFYDLISKFQVGLKSLLRQGLTKPELYGDLVYMLKKIDGSNIFSAQFIKIISHNKKIGYNNNVLQQTACLVVNPITVGNFAFLFNCTLVGRTSDSMPVSKGAKIRNRYNQVPHLTQDTRGKVTNSQLDTSNETKRSVLSQQVTTRHIKHTRTKA